MRGCWVGGVVGGGRSAGEAGGSMSTVAGMFGAWLKDALAVEFGSSRGSKEKDAVLSAIAKMP